MAVLSICSPLAKDHVYLWNYECSDDVEDVEFGWKLPLSFNNGCMYKVILR